MDVAGASENERTDATLAIGQDRSAAGLLPEWRDLDRAD